MQSKTHPGFILAFEGIETSGKSTQVGATNAFLEEAGIDTLPVFEPGGTVTGAAIRHLLLKNVEIPLSPLTEMLLFTASRAQLLEEKVIPHLERGGVVIYDRYVHSTFALQGDTPVNHQVQTAIAGNYFPDLTVYLRIPVSVMQQRLNWRDERDRIENRSWEYFQRAVDYYDRTCQQHPDRWCVVDATLETTQVTQACLKGVCEKLEQAGMYPGRGLPGKG